MRDPQFDALIAVFLWGVTLLLVWAAWTGARRLFPGDDLWRTIVHATVLAWAGIVGVCLVLGGLGLLQPLGVGSLVAAVSLGTIGLVRKYPGQPTMAGIHPISLGWSAVW